MSEEISTTPPAAAEPIFISDSGVADLAADHAKEIHPPDPKATDAELKKLAETLDPTVYVIRDGKPVINKTDGTFKKKTGPRKVEVTAATPAGPDEFAALGTVYAEMTFGLCVTFFGKEWQPVDDQRQRVTHAFGVYLRAKGLKDLPPEFFLASALLGYAADKPQVQAARAAVTRLITKKLAPAAAADSQPGESNGAYPDNGNS